MNKDEILKIVKSELDQSIGGDSNSSLYSNRMDALDYYHGNLPKSPGTGKSSIVSTDVADAVEWILPDVVESLTASNEVVTFDPTGEGDEEQAQLESEYVYSVLMKDNDGFITLYSFIKDMLMQKNGIVKAYYDDNKEESIESFTGINEFQYQGILSSPEIELLEQSLYESETGLTADIKVKRVKDNGKVVVLPVPPEEFRVNSDHNSTNIKDARFVAHVCHKTTSELVEMGYDRKIIDSLPTESKNDGDEDDYRFTSQDEYDAEDTDNKAQRLIEIAECYINLDLDDTGIASLQKVTLAAEKTILDVEEVDEHPLISATAIIMPHKWAGLSIYDRLKEIQDQKTALIRNIFDNIYLQNNGRTVAGKGVNLDDLMVSRPGGVVRANDVNQLSQLKAPPLGAEAFGLIDKLSDMGAGRSGVSPDGAGQSFAVGSETAHGIERIITMKEKLVRLIIRVVAETGVKPLCIRIRELLRRHVDAVQEYKFRDEWKQLNPGQWADRSRVSVRVGLGSGDKQNQLNAMSQVLAYQEKILSNPQQTMVRERNVFAALNDFSKLAGITTAGSYFTDPESDEGKQRKQQQEQTSKNNQLTNQQMQLESIQAQKQLALAETKKAEAAQSGVNVKAQIEGLKAQLKQQDQQSKAEIEWLKQQLKEAEAMSKAAKEQADLRFKYDQMENDNAKFLTEKELEADKELNQQFNDNYIDTGNF